MNKSYVCFFLNTGRLPISTAWTLCLWCSFWRARDTRHSREPRTRGTHGTHGHRRTTRSSWFYGTTRGQGRRRKARKPRPYRSTRTSRKNGSSRVHRPTGSTRNQRWYRGRKGKGNQGAPGLWGPPGALGSNWKQCVFKNLNDDKDTGLIKVFRFFFHLIVISQNRIWHYCFELTMLFKF